MAATEEQLQAVGPLDGRYGDKVAELSPYVSEFGLIRYRVAVEAGWLAVLGSGILPDVERVPDLSLEALENLRQDFNVADAQRVKDIEATTNHDVKAVEIWLRENLGNSLAWLPLLELVHFGRTSEDINNLAYAMMLRDARDEVIRPATGAIYDGMALWSEKYSDDPMLARTHGQPASPSTLGKEMAVFAERTLAHIQRLGSVAIQGKLNGATGNYSAESFVYPEVNWQAVAREFVESLGFEFNTTTTQIEPHDWMVTFFNELAHGNNILTGFSQDIWQYISRNYFRQEVKEGEVGSSTMPHKVNPIDFENAEANFGAANATLNWLAGKLPISRLQRDLSDSSAQRTIGEAFGHSLIALKSVRRGMGKLVADPGAMLDDLRNEWAVLSEPVQTMMRRYGVGGAYDIIKEVARGRSMSAEEYHHLVRKLNIPQEAKRRLHELTPETYLGLAPEIAYGEFLHN